MNLFGFSLLPQLLFVGLADNKLFRRLFQLIAELQQKLALHYHHVLNFSVQSITDINGYLTIFRILCALDRGSWDQYYRYPIFLTTYIIFPDEEDTYRLR